jgi:hypothetical protein
MCLGRWPWALVVCWWNYLELEKEVRAYETGLYSSVSSVGRRPGSRASGGGIELRGAARGGRGRWSGAVGRAGGRENLIDPTK